MLFGAARRMSTKALAGSGTEHVAANNTAEASARLGVIIALVASVFVKALPAPRYGQKQALCSAVSVYTVVGCTKNAGRFFHPADLAGVWLHTVGQAAKKICSDRSIHRTDETLLVVQVDGGRRLDVRAF